MFNEQKISKLFLLTGLLCWLPFFIAFTQPPRSINNSSGTIKGIIIDSLRRNVLSNVNVILRDDANGQLIKGTISKENGSFKFKSVAIKPYELVFSCIGYVSKTIQLPPVTSPITDLHSISLKPTAVELPEVQVVTQKQLIEQDADKLTYNVADDPDKQTLSAFEMLRKIPFLTVDANDNIQMNNNSNYQILVNGKSSSLFVNNPADVFKAMRASTIKSIEVITNPPSRYDAEGSGGIINIVTWKRTIAGFTGSTTVAMESPYALNISSFLMAGTGRFGFSGQVSNNTQQSPANSQSLIRKQKELKSEFEQKGKSAGNNLIQYTTGEVSYNLSAADLVSINYSISCNRSGNNLAQVSTSLDSGRELTSSYERINKSGSKGHGFDIGTNYQHSFKRSEKQLLTMFYKTSNNTNGSNIDFALVPVYNYSSQVSKTNNNDKQKERNFQVDYVHPVHRHTLESGLKSSYILNNSVYFYKHFNTATNDFTPDSALSNNFTYRQLIQAAYAAINLKMKDWEVNIGARLEKTNINASFKSSVAIVSRRYVNFIPNISVSRRLKGFDKMRLSYSQRLERPGLFYLNPYVDVTNPGNISYGNPTVHPAVSHVLNFSYNLFIKRTFFSVGMAHTFTNNAIQQYTSLGNDAIARTTYGNIGRCQSSNVSFMLNTTLFKKLNFSFNGMSSYVRFTSIIMGNRQKNKGVTFSLFSAASYRFNSRWRINSDISCNSSNLSVQGRTAGFIKNNLSVNKQFLKNNKADFGIFISNPFQEKRRSFNEIDDPIFHQIQETWSVIRRFGVTINYRFGKVR